MRGDVNDLMANNNGSVKSSILYVMSLLLRVTCDSLFWQRVNVNATTLWRKEVGRNLATSVILNELNQARKKRNMDLTCLSFFVHLYSVSDSLKNV